MTISRKECPVCKKQFEDIDDIVVCPECGARYHRECYNKVGHCLFEDTHGTDECPCVEKEEKQTSIETKKCPVCSAENPASAIFCTTCGFAFNDKTDDDSNEKSQVDLSSMPELDFLIDPMGGVNPNERFGSITCTDIVKYVRINSAYYLRIFKNIKDFKKSRFNFSAFLFSGGWLLYRKQYKLGSIITAIMAILSIASTYITYFYYIPILSGILSTAGVSLSASMFTQAQSQAILQQILGISPEKMLVLLAPTIMNFISFVIMIVLGFKGNKIYMNNVISKVTKLRTETSGLAEFNDKVEVQGGVDVPLGICLAICYIIINWLPQFFI